MNLRASFTFRRPFVTCRNLDIIRIHRTNMIIRMANAVAIPGIMIAVPVGRVVAGIADNAA